MCDATSVSNGVLCLQAVIGAGAAGLVSIRELLKEGHQVRLAHNTD